METKSKKNKIVYILIICTVVLWGFIGKYLVEFYKAYKDDNETVTANAAQNMKPVLLSGVQDTVSNITQMRDPFAFNKKEAPVKTEAAPKPDEYRALINYKINGVIINKDEKVVVFEDVTSNHTLYLNEGDDYSDIHIVKISIKEVILKEHGLIKTISLEKR